MFPFGTKPAHRRTVAEGRTMLDAGAILVDVRSPREFAAGHCRGALNIPVGALTGRIDELSADRAVVLYCRSGRRSAAAAQVLARAGFTVCDVGAMPLGWD